MIAAVGEHVSSSPNRAAILRPSSEITCVYLIVVNLLSGRGLREKPVFCGAVGRWRGAVR
jgi:hypothetical protein